MNKRQKILTVVGIVALAIWALVLNDAAGQTADWQAKYGSGVGGCMAALLVIVVAYVGLFFVLKSPPKS